MTTITVSEDQNSTRIEIKGHAMYANYGADIVCSAESILSYTLMQTLKDEYEDGNLEAMYIDEGDGYINLTYEPVSYRKEYMQGVTDSIMNGFSLLEHTYPDHVKII